MNRRDALLTTGSMVLSASLGAIACGNQSAVAQNTTPKAPPGPAPAPTPSASPAGQAAAIFEAAHGCITKGDACIAHCIGMITSGDTSMSECLRASRDMHAVMSGLAALAASGNKNLPAFAKVAMELCKDCETQCKKHAHHMVCKECAEACGRTIAACQKLVG